MATTANKRTHSMLSSMMAFIIFFLFVFLPFSSSLSSSSLDLEHCKNDADGTRMCDSTSSDSKSVDKDHKNTIDRNYNDGEIDDGNNINISQKEIPNDNICLNKHDNCAYWASVDECENNPAYMLKSCRKSCGTCKPQIENNKDNFGNTNYRGEDIGELQLIVDERSMEIIEKLKEIQQYVSNVLSTPEYDSVRDECINRNNHCAYWAVLGECDNNPGYMKTTCAPSCMTCQLLDINVRCPMDPNAKNIFLPGELHQMFERIENEYGGRGLMVYSKPGLNYPKEWKKSEHDGVKPIDGPWVLTIDEFLTPEECDELIEQGNKLGYERSQENVRAKNFDGSLGERESSSRTSRNAWCKDNCESDPLVKSVTQKIENLTGIPTMNSEYLQLLRYEVGQFYKTHHDLIVPQIDRSCGPRILTVFFYLSDVEEGGGTEFPVIGLTVNPKKGRMLIWPSVMNSNLNESDDNTRHQALPVVNGIKYGANGWLHLRDFKTPYHTKCT